MKFLPFLILIFLALSACKSTPKVETTKPENQEVPTESTVKPKENKPTVVKPPEKLVGKTKTGKSFIIERKEQEGEVTYVLDGEGFKHTEPTKLFSHAAIKDVLMADLDKDGFDEAYIIYDCKEKGETNPVLAAYVSYKDRAFGPAYVKSASAKQLQGYNGLDSFYVESGQLVRAFPIYKNGEKTGATQKITYVLSAGEASFILTPK